VNSKQHEKPRVKYGAAIKTQQPDRAPGAEAMADGDSFDAVVDVDRRCCMCQSEGTGLLSDCEPRVSRPPPATHHPLLHVGIRSRRVIRGRRRTWLARMEWAAAWRQCGPTLTRTSHRCDLAMRARSQHRWSTSAGDAARRPQGCRHRREAGAWRAERIVVSPRASGRHALGE
jgi:hypothetical protein